MQRNILFIWREVFLPNKKSGSCKRRSITPKRNDKAEKNPITFVVTEKSSGTAQEVKKRGKETHELDKERPGR